jgi:hypothetical protein
MKRLFSNGWIVVLVMLLATGAFADRKAVPTAACDVCLKTSSDGTLDVNWNAETIHNSSLRDEEAVYHDGSFEGQIGCGGGCGFSVRFTAETPIFLTGLTLYTQGGNAAAAVVSIYSDAASAIAGPPTAPVGPYDGTAVWESDPMDLTTVDVTSQFDIVLDNLVLEAGDYYVVVWENSSGFLGIASDLQSNYLDRNWAYSANGWEMINDAVGGDPTLVGNFAISATYLPQDIEGSYMTVDTRNINFGVLQLDDGAVTTDVTIGNIGLEPFDVTAITIAGAGFTTSLVTPVTVPVDGSVVFDVTLTPTAEGPASGTYTITSTADNVTEIIVNAFAMVYDGLPQYMIWNPSASISGEAFLSGLTTLGHTAALTTDLFMFGDPADVGYSGIFVCLGMYGNGNYVLVPNSAEVNALVDYAAAGYPLYMEGGDTWAFDQPTALHAYFGIDGVADGSGDLAIVEGETLVDGIDLAYYGFNNYVDHLAPLTHDAMVFHTNPADGEACGIGNLTPGANTIGTSFEFGGLVDSIGTVSELLAQYLDFMAMEYTDIWAPTIGGVTQFTFTMDFDGPYTIEAYAEDNVGVTSVSLFYNLNNGEFVEVGMTDTGDGIYSGDIPGQPAGTTVAYYIRATDDTANEGFAPEGAPENLFVFSVVSHLPPVFVEAISGLDGQVDLTWMVPGTEAPPLVECADFAVSELPFNASGTNLGFGDDFDVNLSDGEDVSYQLNVMVPSTYTISLCNGTDYDSKLEVFFDDCVTTTGYYNDDACGLQSELTDVYLEAGTYLIVVDGFGGGTGNYTLDVFEQTARNQTETPIVNDLRYELNKLQNDGIDITAGLLSSSASRYDTRELRELLSYGIYRNTTSPVLIDPENLVEVVGLDPLAYSDFPIANEITYFYRILAIYDDGESASEQVEAMPTNHPPMQPLNLAGSVNDETSEVTLTWNANTDYDLVGYNVYRAEALVGTVTDPTFSEIVADGAHSYTVRAYDTGGMESPPSGHVQVLVGDVPPSYPSALSGLDGTIELSWMPPGTELFTVTVEILTDIFGGEVSWDIMNQTGEVVAGTAPGELLGNTLYTWDIELTPSTYTFTIYDTFGDGIYAPAYYSISLNGDLVHTSGGNYGYSESVTFDAFGVIALRRAHYDGVAEGPRGTVPTNIGSLNIVHETIFDNSSLRDLRDLLSYGIYRSETSPVVVDETHHVETVGMNQLNYTDFPLVNGTTYYYVITAIYDSGAGPSEEVSGIPQNHQPMVPVNLSASVDNDINTVTLDWDDNNDYDLAGYHVYRDEVLVGSSTESTYDDVVEDGAYYYTVASFDTGDMISDVSERVQALVGAVPPTDLSADGNFDDHIELTWLVPGNPAPALMDCADELIPSLPFVTNGTNVGMGNDFDVSGTDNEDYAYQLFMAQDGTIDITLCGPNIDYDAKVEIFNGNCDEITSTGYYDDDGPACDAAPGLIGPSEILGAFLPEGVYFVVVDGYSANQGNYDLTITESGTQRQFVPTSTRETLKKLVLNNEMSASEAEAILAAEEPVDFSPVFIESPAYHNDIRETAEISHYNIYRDGSNIGTTSETLYNDAVEEDMPYFYQVTATYANGDESAPTNLVEARANMAPGAPTRLNIEDTGHTVTMTWRDPLLNMDGSSCFDLEGLEIRRNGSLISSVDPLEWTFTDFALPDGHYVYEVSGFDEVPNHGPAVTGEVWVGPKPVIVQVLTDNYPTESSWNIYNSSSEIVASISAGDLTEGGVLYEWALGLEPGTYLFEMLDTWGDGIFAPGYYQVSHDGNILVGPGGDFTTQEITPFIVESTILMGDMDGDGFLNILDVTRFIEIVTHTGEDPTFDEMALMDMNGDGHHNILDVVMLIEEVLNMGGLAKDAPIIEDITATIAPMTLANTREWQNIPVTVDCFEMVAGFQADLVFDPSVVELGIPVLAEGNESVGIFSSISGNTMRVLAIDLAGNMIDLASGLLMSVPVQVIDENASGAMDFSVEDLIISGPGGVEIVAECLVSVINIGLSAPTEFSLQQNYPNPFNPITNIRYDIAESGDTRLVIYNMLGQEVRTLVNGNQDVGRYEVTWNGLDNAGEPVATGIYIYHMKAAGYSKTIKMAYIK